MLIHSGVQQHILTLDTLSSPNERPTSLVSLDEYVSSKKQRSTNSYPSHVREKIKYTGSWQTKQKKRKTISQNQIQ